MVSLNFSLQRLLCPLNLIAVFLPESRMRETAPGGRSGKSRGSERRRSERRVSRKRRRGERRGGRRKI